MERAVPLWLVLLLALIGVLFLVPFGWAVRVSSAGDDRAGVFGTMAFQVATFPSLVRQSISQLTNRLNGMDREIGFRVARDQTDLAGFEPVRMADGAEMPGLLVRGGSSSALNGWRILVGGFILDGNVESAALLVSPELRIVKVWRLIAPELDDKLELGAPHGVAVLDDGSIVVAHEGARELQRIGRCNEAIWIARGHHFHHAVTRAESNDFVWTFSEPQEIAKVSTETGEIVESFTTQDIIDANPLIELLQVRRQFPDNHQTNEHFSSGKWLPDSTHLNDVDPLPAAIADRFPDFKAGDLLISARSLNLLFVVDPDTRHVKWWYSGATERQHDSDWEATGEISALNNRMSRDYSEIVAIDPRTYRARRVFDGRKANFFTRIRGKHQTTPDGELLFVSPQQGRALEVDPGGNVMLEFLNTIPGDDTKNFIINDFIWLPSNAIDPAALSCAN